MSALHLRPRRDSGAAELWQWARQRRGSWTCPDAADACGISQGRCRAIVRAMLAAGYLDQAAKSELTSKGRMPALWRLSPTGRALDGPPVMITDQANGLIIGFRPSQ